MRYNERKEFLYSPEIGNLYDTQTALRIYAEYVKKASPKIYPKFFEVNRKGDNVDNLWHMPLTERTIFTRELNVPVIVKSDRPDWRLTRLGLTPIQRFKFIVATLHLHPMDESAKQEEMATGLPPIRLDYFPQRGDQIYYIGYRLMITKVVPEQEGAWGQTNVYLGFLVECCIAPEGDARPLIDLSTSAPAEKPGTPNLTDWPGPPPTGPVPHSWP